MNFASEVYIHEAVKVGLIKSDAPDDVASFKYGHLLGFDAIKLYFHAKSTQHIPTVTRSLKKLCAITLERLRSSFFNGAPLDMIVKDATNVIGERVVLYQCVIEAHSCKPFLSFDKTHTLPSYTAHDIDVSDGQYEIYDDLFDGIPEAERPRSREAIRQLLECKKLPIPHLDDVIHYLIKRALV